MKFWLASVNILIVNLKLVKNIIILINMLSPLRYLFINDDRETFTCVLPTQYSIFSVNPFEMKYSRKNFGFSLGSAVTCQGYRFIAFSGLPADPEFDTRHVCIFDHDKIKNESQDEKKKSNPLIFLHEFELHILSMRITPQFLIVTFHHHFEIWDINANKPLQQISTALNVHAPCDITTDYKLLAVAGRELYNCDLYLLNESTSIPVRAADETVSLVKFSRTPGLLATASLDGKIVRVFNTTQIKDSNSANNCCIGKFKRGFKASVIHSIDFSPNNQFMVIVSQNGTLHFFDLKNKPPSSSPQTYTSIQKISIGQQDVSYILWQNPSLIIVLTMAGIMISISIDEDTCNEVGREQLMFLRMCDDIQV